MRIQNKYLSLIFKFIAFLVGVFGISVQCGIFSGEFHFLVLNYYTLISNILCTLYFLGAFIYGIKKEGTFLPQIKGAIVMCITVTGLIYHFMLSGSFTMTGTLAISNICLHYLMPLMTILDWLLFDKKGVYKKYSPLLWIIIPYLYIAYVYIAALFSSTYFDGRKYPYFFFDIDTLGVGKVVLIVLGLTIFFIILGYIIYFVDHALSIKKEKSCGCIVIDDKKVLLVKHQKGHYGFPKGHIKKGESYEETAVREVKEETNIDALITASVPFKIKYSPKENTKKTVRFYLARPLTNEIIKQDEEVSEAKYYSYDEALKLLTFEDEKNILKEIEKLLK